MELFKDYPAQVINWATHHEGLSLAAGRKLFGDRAVLGGFVNGKKGLLYQGEREAIEQETRRLVAEAGSRGLILGADCTVPDDFQWTLRLGASSSCIVRRKEREMKKISGWCILVTVLFLLLGLSKVALASSQGKAKKDPDMARLEKIPAHSLSLLRPSDLAGILLLEDQ